MKTIEELRSLNPCKDGLEWAKQQPSLAEAWDTCQRSDWMWWLLMNINKCPRKLSIQYSKWCADSVKHLLNTATTAESEAANAATNAKAYAANAADDAANSANADAANAATTAAYAYAVATANATYANAVTANAAVATANAYTAYADAFAAARSKQADYLRSIVPNPFL